MAISFKTSSSPTRTFNAFMEWKDSQRSDNSTHDFLQLVRLMLVLLSNSKHHQKVIYQMLQSPKGNLSTFVFWTNYSLPLFALITKPGVDGWVNCLSLLWSHWEHISAHHFLQSSPPLLPAVRLAAVKRQKEYSSFCSWGGGCSVK